MLWHQGVNRLFMRQGFERLRDEGTSLVYTSHYLDEVEALCDRIVIMDHGRNLATGTLQELKEMVSLNETIYVYIDEADRTARLRQELMALPDLDALEDYQDGWKLSFHSKAGNMQRILEVLEQNQTSYRSLYSHEPSLNDVFLELTGKELRDA